MDAAGTTDSGERDLPFPERLVEFVLFAPFELTARVIEELPGAVRRGHERIQAARVIGRFAVREGTREIRRRLDDAPSRPVASRAAPSRADAVDTPEPVPGSLADSSADVHGDSTVGGSGGPTSDDLALPDYDHLPAAHIVTKLETLTADERDLIELYEIAHRHRRTVLGKIGQLRS